MKRAPMTLAGTPALSNPTLRKRQDKMNVNVSIHDNTSIQKSPIPDGTTWGRWRWDARTQELVDLKREDFSIHPNMQSQQAWLGYMASKGDVSDTDLLDLEAALTALGVQAYG